MEGIEIEIGTGKERKTITFVSIGGVSLDIYIGDQPCDKESTSEFGLGLADYLAVGHYRIDTNNPDYDVRGGVVLHLGIGFGSPVYVSGNLPVGEEPKWKK